MTKGKSSSFCSVSVFFSAVASVCACAVAVNDTAAASRTRQRIAIRSLRERFVFMVLAPSPSDRGSCVSDDCYSGTTSSREITPLWAFARSREQTLKIYFTPPEKSRALLDKKRFSIKKHEEKSETGSLQKTTIRKRLIVFG